MNCPRCNQKTGVTNTAAAEGLVLRRRECKACHYVFITKEAAASIEDQGRLNRLLNAKRDGRYKSDKTTTENL